MPIKSKNQFFTKSIMDDIKTKSKIYMQKGGMIATLLFAAAVCYSIIASVPDRIKEKNERQEELQKKFFALKVNPRSAKATPEKVQISELNAEVIYEGSKRPESLENGFWLMKNISNIYLCVQTTRFECYSVSTDDKSLALIRSSAKNGIELQKDKITENAWNNFVAWDKTTNELSVGDKLLLKTLFHLL